MMPSKLGPPEDYYERLELAIRNFPGDVFSISGGGDPLHNFEENIAFWSTIAQLCQIYNKQIDIHSAYLQKMIEVFSYFRSILRKPVIHCFPETWDDSKEGILQLQKLSPRLRINFVIDHQLDTIALDVEDFCNTHAISFSYRQLIGSNLYPVTDSLFYTEVETRTQYGRYIKQDDYNVYFSPQGDLKLKYMEI